MALKGGRHEVCSSVSHDRIAQEIGKGGDLLVSAVLGPDVERLHGDALRRARTQAFREQIARDGVRFFPGVGELLDAVRARGLRTAIAASASSEDIALLEKHLGRSGVESGYVRAEELSAAGARFVARDLPHLTASLDEALAEK